METHTRSNRTRRRVSVGFERLSTDVIGVPISAVNLQAAVSVVLRWIRDKERTYVAVADVHSVIKSQTDMSLMEVYHRAGMVVPDGVPLVWLLKLKGRHQVGRVAGTDFMNAVSEALATTGGSAFYYGGGAGVADVVSTKLERQYPGLVTSGTFCPPFRTLSDGERDEIVQIINADAPDVVWVSLGAPKQEKWIAEFREDLDAPVLIGIGAAFDFVSGDVRRAPVLVQRFGLEWLFRVFQEPRRLWKRYAQTIPMFLYYLAARRVGLYSPPQVEPSRTTSTRE